MCCEKQRESSSPNPHLRLSDPSEVYGLEGIPSSIMTVSSYCLLTILDLVSSYKLRRRYSWDLIQLSRRQFFRFPPFWRLMGHQLPRSFCFYSLRRTCGFLASSIEQSEPSGLARSVVKIACWPGERLHDLAVCMSQLCSYSPFSKLRRKLVAATGKITGRP